MTVFVGAERLAGPTVPAHPSPEATAVDFGAMTVAQLRELCAERGIDAPKRATKGQLIELLSE